MHGSIYSQQFKCNVYLSAFMSSSVANHLLYVKKVLFEDSKENGDWKFMAEYEINRFRGYSVKMSERYMYT